MGKPTRRRRRFPCIAKGGERGVGERVEDCIATNPKNKKKKMKKQDKIIIGIDPDSKKSGVAILHMPDKVIHTEKMTFAEVLDLLMEAKEDDSRPDMNVRIIIEGGWLNSSNWHTAGRYMTANVAAEIGRRTGMNHQTGILISELCQSFGLDAKIVKPLKKIWRGRDGKITQQEAERFMGKLPRMNQDQRDALLLAWVYSGLPVYTGIPSAKL